MKTRKLGDGLEVSAIGLGCMGMGQVYGTALEPAAAHKLLARAVELGVPFYPLVSINFPVYDADALPPELEAVPAVKPGSRKQ